MKPHGSKKTPQKNKFQKGNLQKKGDSQKKGNLQKNKFQKDNSQKKGNLQKKKFQIEKDPSMLLNEAIQKKGILRKVELSKEEDNELFRYKFRIDIKDDIHIIDPITRKTVPLDPIKGDIHEGVGKTLQEAKNNAAKKALDNDILLVINYEDLEIKKIKTLLEKFNNLMLKLDMKPKIECEKILRKEFTILGFQKKMIHICKLKLGKTEHVAEGDTETEAKNNLIIDVLKTNKLFTQKPIDFSKMNEDEKISYIVKISKHVPYIYDDVIVRMKNSPKQISPVVSSESPQDVHITLDIYDPIFKKLKNQYPKLTRKKLMDCVEKLKNKFNLTDFDMYSLLSEVGTDVFFVKYDDNNFIVRGNIKKYIETDLIDEDVFDRCQIRNGKLICPWSELKNIYSEISKVTFVKKM